MVTSYEMVTYEVANENDIKPAHCVGTGLVLLMHGMKKQLCMVPIIIDACG